jgi:hypothetical protein
MVMNASLHRCIRPRRGCHGGGEGGDTADTHAGVARYAGSAPSRGRREATLSNMIMAPPRVPQGMSRTSSVCGGKDTIRAVGIRMM